MADKKSDSSKVLKEVVKFADANLQQFESDSIAKTNVRLLDLQITDINSKIVGRICLTVIFLTILIIQNVSVFALVFWAFEQNKLVEIQPLLAVLITGTLGETAFTINMIVKWMFKDIRYQLHNK